MSAVFLALLPPWRRAVGRIPLLRPGDGGHDLVVHQSRHRRFLSSAVEKAGEKATLLVVELDTPGGLDSAMRQMVQEIIRSPVPVAVYVFPSGARAASAGVLITLASDIAAMAPGTNIGAAHPVGIGGGGMDNTMAKKVENDAAAYARSLAEKKGRNGEWAERRCARAHPLRKRTPKRET